MGVSYSCGGGGAVMREGEIQMLGFVYLQPPNYFHKEEREEAQCVRGTKGHPRGLMKMSHPQRKHGVDKNTQVPI